MTTAIVNPGTGRVERATADAAWTNMEALRDATKLEGIRFERDPDGDDADGRWDFLVHREGRTVRVSMPGVDLATVRSRDLLEAPRLYVDGNSWWWSFAVNAVRDTLTGERGRWGR